MAEGCGVPGDLQRHLAFADRGPGSQDGDTTGHEEWCVPVQVREPCRDSCLGLPCPDLGEALVDDLGNAFRCLSGVVCLGEGTL